MSSTEFTHKPWLVVDIYLCITVLFLEKRASYLHSNILKCELRTSKSAIELCELAPKMAVLHVSADSSLVQCSRMLLFSKICSDDLVF